MSSFNFELTKSFEYSHKGEIETAQFIEVSEPAVKHIEFTAPIRQALMRAIAEAQSNSKSDGGESSEDGEIDGGTLIAILESSSVEFGKLLLQFKEVATKSKLFQVEGCEKLTAPLFDRLCVDDVYRMFGEFLRAFIAASLLK